MINAVEILESEIDFLAGSGPDEEGHVYLITAEGLFGVLRAYAEIQSANDGPLSGKSYDKWEEGVWELQHEYILRLKEAGHLVSVAEALLPRK